MKEVNYLYQKIFDKLLQENITIEKVFPLIFTFKSQNNSKKLKNNKIKIPFIE